MNKVLVVDDNEQNRGACKIALEDYFHLHFAENGREGLEKVREFNPDVILLDIMMPVMDGYEMLKQLKSDSEFSDIPVLMLTADANVESIERCLGMGADDYVMKPFNVRILKARAGGLAWKGHLEKEKKEDLRTGSVIQRQFLTGEKTVIEIFNNVGFQVTVFNQTPMTISGDFYYPKRISSHSAGLFFADTCGHGISAALISMRILSVIDHLRSPTHYPSEFLAVINEDICELIPPGHFVAAGYLILDKEEGIFVISNAGLPSPIWMRGETVEEVNISGMPLGLARSLHSDVEKKWSPGDRLIFYTDGMTEAMNESGEQYGKERLLKCIRENARLPLEEFKNGIIADLGGFAGEKNFEDDVTLIIFENQERVN